MLGVTFRLREHRFDLRPAFSSAQVSPGQVGRRRRWLGPEPLSQPNLPSGGQVANIEIGAFLIAAGNGPEKQELLRLIGTLV
jgi:hypothetical protein